MRDLDHITETIIDAAIQIHRDLGPDLHPTASYRWSERIRPRGSVLLEAQHNFGVGWLREAAQHRNEHAPPGYD